MNSPNFKKGDVLQEHNGDDDDNTKFTVYALKESNYLLIYEDDYDEDYKFRDIFKDKHVNYRLKFQIPKDNNKNYHIIEGNIKFIDKNFKKVEHQEVETIKVMDNYFNFLKGGKRRKSRRKKSKTRKSKTKKYRKR